MDKNKYLFPSFAIDALLIVRFLAKGRFEEYKENVMVNLPGIQETILRGQNVVNLYFFFAF